MQLTKLGHACVRLTKETGTLVVDPGTLTGPGAVEGADAVLITHEHPDHFDEGRLRAALAAAPALQVWTNAAVAERLDGLGGRVHVVGEGAAFEAAGFSITTHGAWHAEIHPEVPRIGNVGFFVDDTVFHPGDALTVPDRAVDTLLVPLHGPWARTGELIDWLREVGARQAYGVHDGGLSEFGRGLVGGLLGERGPGTGTPLTLLQPQEGAAVG